MAYETERRKAIEAVVMAAKLCRIVQSSFPQGGSLGKSDGSPVTVADFGAQALIALHLSAAFPEDKILGEEQSAMLRLNQNADIRGEVISRVRALRPGLSADAVLDAIDLGAGKILSEERFWTVDPIDGTKGFIRGDHYAVALALLKQGRVVLGVLGCPNLPLHPGKSTDAEGTLFAAVVGEGTMMRGFEDPEERQVSVEDLIDPSMALICESLESSHASHGDSARLGKALELRKPPLRVDSQCKYGLVARGEATLYLRITPAHTYLEKIWDHAAGALIVEEAGGRVTDLAGKPLNFSAGRELVHNRGIIASNGKVHEAVLDAVQRLGL